MQFQTREQLAVHYAQVRKRLWYSAYKPPVVKAIPATVKKVEVPNVELVGPWSAPTNPAQNLITEIAIKHGITYLEVISNHRFRKYMLPRFECCYRLKNELNLSFPEIGRRMGGRDHTSILHGYRKFKRMIDDNSIAA